MGSCFGWNLWIDGGGDGSSEGNASARVIIDAHTPVSVRIGGARRETHRSAVMTGTLGGAANERRRGRTFFARMRGSGMPFAYPRDR